MKNWINSVLAEHTSIIEKPKQLFLVDAIGALLSAFLLGVVLVEMEQYFGIPPSTLYFLASIPCVFAVFDIYCIISISKNSGTFLKFIAIANLMYCALSISLAFTHIEVITYLGWIYIVGEVLLVSFLAYVELVISRKVKE